MRMPRSSFLPFRCGENFSDLKIAPDDLQILVLIEITCAPCVTVSAVRLSGDMVEVPEKEKDIPGCDPDVPQIRCRSVDLSERREPVGGLILSARCVQVGVNVAMKAEFSLVVVQVVQQLGVGDDVLFQLRVSIGICAGNGK